MGDKDEVKNYVNAYLAEKFNIGDKVKVIKTGKVGLITKKNIYNRDHMLYNSPYGYTSIQVTFSDCKRNYSPQSLLRIKKGKSL